MNFKTITKFTLTLCAILNMHNAFSAANDDFFLPIVNVLDQQTIITLPGANNNDPQIIQVINDVLTPQQCQTISDWTLNQIDINQLNQDNVANFCLTVHDTLGNVLGQQVINHYHNQVRLKFTLGIITGFSAQTIVHNNTPTPNILAALQICAPPLLMLYRAGQAIAHNNCTQLMHATLHHGAFTLGNASGTATAILLRWIKNKTIG